MKKLGVFFVLLLFSCQKEGANAPSTNYSNSNANTTSVAAKDTSFIHITIDSVPMLVTTIEYDRTSTSLHLLAGNAFQEVQLFSYNYWGTSGLNFQCEWYITYSTRTDTLSNWVTDTAKNTTTHLFFECCALPVRDSPISGTFGAQFGLKDDVDIEAKFHLIFK